MVFCICLHLHILIGSTVRSITLAATGITEIAWCDKVVLDNRGTILLLQLVVILFEHFLIRLWVHVHILSFAWISAGTDL